MDIDKLIESMTPAQYIRFAEKLQAALGTLPVRSESARSELAAAISAGITDGTRPNAYATRAQVARMVLRAGKGRDMVPE